MKMRFSRKSWLESITVDHFVAKCSKELRNSQTNEKEKNIRRNRFSVVFFSLLNLPMFVMENKSNYTIDFHRSPVEI